MTSTKQLYEKIGCLILNSRDKVKWCSQCKYDNIPCEPDKLDKVLYVETPPEPEAEVRGQTGELKGLQCPECEATDGFLEMETDKIFCNHCKHSGDIGEFMGVSQ